MEELAAWSNANNAELLDQAHKEIWHQRRQPPPILDPCRRRHHTSRSAASRPPPTHLILNPVAVLINKALIEIPPKLPAAAGFSKLAEINLPILAARHWASQDVRRYSN